MLQGNERAPAMRGEVREAEAKIYLGDGIGESQWVPVYRMTPDEAQEYIKEVTGKEAALNCAKTLYKQVTGEAQILIDSTLPDPIQEVLLEHERAQLEVMTNYAKSTGRSVHGVLPKAHEVGLAAGIRLAEELGVLEEYLRLKGVDSIQELS